MEKNAKNVPFFYKERKRTQKTFRSFIKNAKERKERRVLLKTSTIVAVARFDKVILSICNSLISGEKVKTIENPFCLEFLEYKM